MDTFKIQTDDLTVEQTADEIQKILMNTWKRFECVRESALVKLKWRQIVFPYRSIPDGS